MDAQRIQVEVQGSKVILKGSVRSWAEKQEAEEWHGLHLESPHDEFMLTDEHALNHLVYISRIKERFKSEEWSTQGPLGVSPQLTHFGLAWFRVSAVQ